MCKKILLDCNSFDFIQKHITEIDERKSIFEFYYIWSQEIELNNIKELSKRIMLNEIKEQYSQQTAGVFMLNVPCLNVPSYFIKKELYDKVRLCLEKYHCKKHNKENNFINDLNLAISAYLNKYAVLTNDGAWKNKDEYKKQGLLPALKELNIECYSHKEFEDTFLQI